MNIRKAEKSDKEKLLPLILESQLFQKQELEKENIKKIDEYRKGVEENFNKWIEEKDKVYFVAEEDNYIVGYIFLMLDGVVSSTVSLSDLFVVSEKRKRGIAKKLIDYALEYAKSEGGENIFLAVNKINDLAISFYKKAGFTEKEDGYTYLEKKL